MTSGPPDSLISQVVLPHYEVVRAGATAQRFGTGLINQTYLVSDGRTRFVLQKVNPIFPTNIHDNIEAVTAHLVQEGVLTPKLIRTDAGALCLELGEHGVWRLMGHIDGVSFDVIRTPAQAHAAGAMVGRFHRALDGLHHHFTGMRLGVHDTPRHLERLQEAVAKHPQHRLHGEVKKLATPLLAAAARLPALPAMSDRVCHGDLKFNNILFAAAEGPGAERPLCLIDLDTAGPGQLAFELGDAWRSWCNRNGENRTEAALDLEIFRTSLGGYREGLARPLSREERLALLLGLEWVSLELAARFAADALQENYFGWDPKQFAGRGEHNLVRARGQWSLHQAVMATRPTRVKLLDLDGEI